MKELFFRMESCHVFCVKAIPSRHFFAYPSCFTVELVLSLFGRKLVSGKAFFDLK